MNHSLLVTPRRRKSVCLVNGNGTSCREGREGRDVAVGGSDGRWVGKLKGLKPIGDSWVLQRRVPGPRLLPPERDAFGDTTVAPSVQFSPSGSLPAP